MLARTRLAVVHVHAVGAEQTAEPAEPGERAQDRAEIARILNLMQIDGALAGLRRGCRQQRHDRRNALR